MKEEFRWIKGFEGYYMVSNFGRIYSFPRYDNMMRKNGGYFMSAQISPNGYEIVHLMLNGKRIAKYVHKVLAESFIPNPIGKKEVDHIDANKSNNRLDNLQAVTNSKNVKKAYEQNTYINPHKGRGIWIIATNKKTNEKYNFKSLRQCEEFTKIDRHRISLFLKNERPNYTDWNFEYDE